MAKVTVTKEDLFNNPGVDLKTIAEVKSQYHFHELSSVVLHNSTLICTFAVDEDPSSIFYTLPENGNAPVRLYKLKTIPTNITIAPDSLSVLIDDDLISSEEIWGK